MAPMCLEQLRYAGVFEAVAIRKQGFPFRYLHNDFYMRFRCIHEPKWLPINPPNGDYLSGCKKIIQSVSKDPMAAAVKDCQIGHTMVLYKSKQSAALELKRAIVAEKCATKMEAAYRGYRSRKLIKELSKHVQPLLAAIRSRDRSTITTALTNASSLWFKMKLVYDAE